MFQACGFCMTQNTEGMPPEIAEVYEPLYQDVCWLHAKWEIFRQLYAEKEENVELMNVSAPTFFRMYQDVSLDDILLTISRLTDPYRTSKSDNLSMEQLVSRVNATAHPLLRDELKQLLDRAASQCSFARTLRHKRIAHNDLLTKLKASVDPLPIITLKKIEGALTAIRSIMNKVEQYYQNTTVMYDHMALHDNGNTILARLREAKTYREHKRQNSLTAREV